MTTTHVYFDGGTKDGKIEVIDGQIDGDIFQQAGFFDKEELYRQTDEQRVIDGIAHTVFRYDGTIPTKG